MHFTIHTDYGLRFLTYAALQAPNPVSVKDAASRFGISAHHLMKVAQRLTKSGWIEAVRGRSGGFRLARPAGEIRIGQVARSLEPDFGLVECMRGNRASSCPITPACRLPRLLASATEAFLSVLDQCTLADLIADNRVLIRILEVAS